MNVVVQGISAYSPTPALAKPPLKSIGNVVRVFQGHFFFPSRHRGRGSNYIYIYRIGLSCNFAVRLYHPRRKASGMGIFPPVPNLSADKPFHDVPGSVKSFPFHTSVVKMEFVLAGGTLPFDELREMQSAGRGGFALPRSQAA